MLKKITKIFWLGRNYFLKIPTRIAIDLTDNCNHDCNFCIREINSKKKDLDMIFWNKKLSDIKSYINEGFIILGGGEPFLFKNIFEFLELSKKKGFYVHIMSNGSLITKDKAKKISEIGLDSISISIESLNSKIQNILTKRNSSLKKTLQGINNLKKYQNKNSQPKIFINVVIMKPNYKELFNLLKFAKKKKLDGIKFLPLSYNPDNNKHQKIHKNIMIGKNEKEEVSRIINDLIKLKKTEKIILNTKKDLKLIKKYYCSTDHENKQLSCDLKRRVCIMPDGEVHLCSRLPSLGNIKKNDLKRLLKNKNHSILLSKKCNYNCILSCARESSIKEKLNKIKNILFISN